MIRSRWFWVMNSRGRPWRPAGSRGEASAGGVGSPPAFALTRFVAPFAVPFAMQSTIPETVGVKALAQRLDQQLVLGRPRAEVGHDRHVDQLGQEVFAAFDAAAFDPGEDGAVDRPGDDFGRAAGDRVGLLQLLAA